MMGERDWRDWRLCSPMKMLLADIASVLHLDGEVLKLGSATIVDFGNHDELTRYRGYLVDGALLPYPFKDRISEADWESGAFKKRS